MEERNCPMCSQRKKERSPEEYKKLINRLSRIEGQIRGIRSMVENRFALRFPFCASDSRNIRAL